MCRFVAFIGREEVLISDIIIKPKHSLVKQSLMSRESHTITNGDGFGLGWYTHFDKDPALFTSLSPAWNDRNLDFIARKTKSALFFAHVRAASSGGISQFNCHPFIYENWMFMHNGWIAEFDKVKRDIQQLLDDDLFNWIKGNTDSELIFALFLQLHKKSKKKDFSQVPKILYKAIQIIDALVKKHNKKSVSNFNICLTDGEQITAFRYCTSKYTKPETMYLSSNACKKGETPNFHIITSEKLTNSPREWKLIPPNAYVIIQKNRDYAIQKIK